MTNDNLFGNLIITVFLTILGVGLIYGSYRAGYKAGYTMSLVNQEKGTPHEFILEEKDNGEFVWVKNKEGKVE